MKEIPFNNAKGCDIQHNAAHLKGCFNVKGTTGAYFTEAETEKFW